MPLSGSQDDEVSNRVSYLLVCELKLKSVISTLFSKIFSGNSALVKIDMRLDPTREPRTVVIEIALCSFSPGFFFYS